MCNLAHCHLRLLHIKEAEEFASVCKEYAAYENDLTIINECNQILDNIAVIDAQIQLNMIKQNQNNKNDK